MHGFHLSGRSPHMGQIQKNVRPLRALASHPKAKPVKPILHLKARLLNDKQEEEDREITLVWAYGWAARSKNQCCLGSVVLF